MKWIQGQIVENRCLEERLCALRVEAQIEPFLAGQFTKLALDIDGERVARPYSFVNAPHENILEFYFNAVPNGSLSSRLCALKAGDLVWVSAQPIGFLTLSEIPDAEHLWLLSSGTAIGPFISILKTDEPWLRFSKITLVHGVKKTNELVYQDVIHELKKREPERFKMVSFVSREDADFALKGRIPEAITSGELEKTVGLSFDADLSQVMICGSPGMVNDTREALKLRGLRKHLRFKPGHITVESYM